MESITEKLIKTLSEIVIFLTRFTWHVPGGSVGKESTFNARDTGDVGLIPRLGRFPGEGNGNPLQYSCLENPMERGAWRATVHGGHRVRHD